MEIFNTVFMLNRAVSALIRLWVMIIFMCVSFVTHAHKNTLDLADGIPALGYGSLEYVPPAPGSYELPPLGAAPDGTVIDSSGDSTSLHDIYGERISLLSFIYSNCSDVNGCPLSTYVLNQIKSTIQGDASLAASVKLVSISFDPERDTPEVMQHYELENSSNAPGDVEWAYVTTRSEAEIQPILEAYKQDVTRQMVGEGSEQSVEISHLLKVFLIDQNRKIRNIYSVSFLHADLIINDIKTLFTEATQPDNTQQIVGDESSLSRPGDAKKGYETAGYLTNSLSLENRLGQELDLVGRVEKVPVGLPRVPVPDSNPISANAVKLGRKLFFDRRLSINDTVSCAMCHVPEQGFTSNEISTAVGVEGRSVRRNAPSLYNVAYLTRLFHDGREDKLEQQVWGPLLDRNEMANPSVGYIVNKIKSFSDYNGLFEKAFAGKGVEMEGLGKALASYQRTLISGNSPFDRWYFNKEREVLSLPMRRGFSLFTGKAGCSSCHTINQDYALFTDNAMHNTGLGYRNSILDSPEPRRIVLAPGVFIDVDPAIIASVGHPAQADVGLYEITEDPADRWKYKTPSLRNVALTSPYMHNGQFGSLKEVVEFYNEGGVEHDLLSPLIKPLDLSSTEVDDIVAFLKSLTGDDVNALVSDAFAAPVGDPDS